MQVQTPVPSSVPGDTLSQIEAVDVELSVVLGRSVLPMSQLLKMGRGAVIPLDASEHDEVSERDEVSDSDEASDTRRSARDEQIGEAAAFLLSNKARYISGQTIYVDAGYNTLG